jgi:hypothetical protein
MRPLAVIFLLAVAPALAAPPAHLKSLPAGLVARGPAPAALAGEGGRSRLWLPGGERAFEVERVVQAGPDTTRFGRIAGVGSAVVTLGPDGGFASVTQGGTLWRIEYRDGAAWALRTGEGGLPIADFGDDAALPPGFVPPKAAAGRASVLPQAVDFLGLYDAGFAARYPGTLAQTRIAHLVAFANQAFVDSDVMVTLRIVHTRVAPGTVHPNIEDNVYALYDAQGGGTFGGVDVRGLRASYGADVVSFFRTHDLYARGFCGYAFFPGGSQSGVNVVVDGASGGSLCSEHTFAHELGHNLGARHQASADSTPGRAHAFARPGQFTTIMASVGTGSPDRARRLSYFSNPRIACGNLACGDASADNTAVINENAERVANYRTTRVRGTASRPAPTLADSDGDGAIDRVDAFPFDPARSADSDGDGSADADDAFPANATEWRDTDLGGQGDNGDGDDDNDGVGDSADRFPLDPLEWADADDDGHGDNGDAFDADPREQRDTDGDGLGDRADGDDDDDGAVDVGASDALAGMEVLVADGATDRILRFDGSTFAPLGTLAQLGAGEVTFRSGIVAAPDGAIYFVAASQLRMLDRLRANQAELMLDPPSHPQIGAGFPFSPTLLSSGDLMLGEMGLGALVTLRPAPSRAAAPRVRTLMPSAMTAPHVCREGAGELLVLDGGATGSLRRYAHAGDPLASPPTLLSAFEGAVPSFSSGDTTQGPAGMLYWVDRRDGAVRSLNLPNSVTLPDADAAALATAPDGWLLVAKRAGGVHFYGGDGFEVGEVIPAALVAEPLAIALAPRILDDDLPPIVPPVAPSPTADPVTSPAVVGSASQPPCTTDCIKPFGTGGAFDAWPALLLALAGRWRRRARHP